MNRVSLIGRLAADPKSDYSKEGKCYCHFSVYVWGKDGDSCISCTAFGNNAERLVKAARKGFRVGVSGSIKTGQYKDKDGFTRYTTEVVCDIVETIDYVKQEVE